MPKAAAIQEKMTVQRALRATSGHPYLYTVATWTQSDRSNDLCIMSNGGRMGIYSGDVCYDNVLIVDFKPSG